MEEEAFKSIIASCTFVSFFLTHFFALCCFIFSRYFLSWFSLNSCILFHYLTFHSTLTNVYCLNFSIYFLVFITYHFKSNGSCNELKVTEVSVETQNCRAFWKNHCQFSVVRTR